MALPTDVRLLNNLASTTLDEIYGEMSDQYFKTNPLVMRLLQLEKARGGGTGKFIKQRGAGVRIRETIIYNKIPGSSYDDSDTFNADNHEFMTQLEFRWKHVYVPVNFNAIEVAQNSGNDEVQFFDIVQATAENAFNSLLDLYGYLIYGSKADTDGTVIPNPTITTKDPDGLYNALDTALNASPTYPVYGGIVRSGTYGDPGFAVNANVVDAGNAPLSIPLLQTGYSQCVFNQLHPDIGLCERPLWNQLYERAQAADRNPPGPLRDVGFETIKFNGAEVVPDDHALPGNFYWPTAEAWRLWILEGRDLVRRAKAYGFDQGFPLPTQDRTVDQLVLSSDLVCPGTRYQCLIVNINQG